MTLGRPGPAAALMLVVAASLALMSSLHVSGALGGSPPFDGSHAGTAEAVICLVLVAGAVSLLRRPGSGRNVAIAATAFAIVGFLVGLSFTVRGSDTTGIAYHVVVLPVLVLLLAALLPIGGPSGPRGRSSLTQHSGR